MNHSKLYYYAKRSALLIGYISLLIAPLAFAGAPFITEDPETQDYKTWELEVASAMLQTKTTTDWAALYVEIDYGIYPNLDFEVTFPFGASLPRIKEPQTYGFSDIEVEIKYRFIQETNYLPQVAIVPVYFIPTGNAKRDLGNGKGFYEIPISFQKSWGTWTSYASIGVGVNHAKDMKNYTFAGLVVQKELTERVMLGMEIFSVSKLAVDEPGFVLVNAGGSYNLTKNFAYLFSIGHTLSGNNYYGYLGFQWNF